MSVVKVGTTLAHQLNDVKAHAEANDGVKGAEAELELGILENEKYDHV